MKATESADQDLRYMSIVLRSLTAPLKQIAENAGREGSVVVERVKQKRQALVMTLDVTNIDKLGRALLTQRKSNCCC